MFLTRINFKSFEVISLLIVNCIAFIWAFAFGLELFGIVLFLWTETVVVGFFNGIKLFYCKNKNNGEPAPALLRFLSFLFYISLLLIVLFILFMGIGYFYLAETYEHNTMVYLISIIFLLVVNWCELKFKYLKDTQIVRLNLTDQFFDIIPRLLLLGVICFIGTFFLPDYGRPNNPILLALTLILLNIIFVLFLIDRVNVRRKLK